jgi:antitoxin YefM
LIWWVFDRCTPNIIAAKALGVAIIGVLGYEADRGCQGSRSFLTLMAWSSVRPTQVTSALKVTLIIFLYNVCSLRSATMEAITYSEARNNLAKHIDRVINDCDFTVITRQRGEATVLMSLREFESWKETMFLLRGKNGPRLLQSVENIRKRKNLVKRELVEE